MARRRHDVRTWEERQADSRKILRTIGASNPYAGADPAEVEQRLRNMNYGATNSRITKLRREAPHAPPDQ